MRYQTVHTSVAKQKLFTSIQAMICNTCVRLSDRGGKENRKRGRDRRMGEETREEGKELGEGEEEKKGG